LLVGLNLYFHLIILCQDYQNPNIIIGYALIKILNMYNMLFISPFNIHLIIIIEWSTNYKII
jgi:hypothetical protein